MPNIVVIDRAGTRKAVDAPSDKSVMLAIRAAGFDELVALCGGSCSCATCHVYVDAAFLEMLPPMGEDERELLEDAENFRPDSRLSCQLRVDDSLEGLIVRIAPEN